MADLTQAESSTGSAVQALRASEEFKSRLIACSRDCMKVLDLDGPPAIHERKRNAGIRDLRSCSRTLVDERYGDIATVVRNL